MVSAATNSTSQIETAAPLKATTASSPGSNRPAQANQAQSAPTRGQDSAVLSSAAQAALKEASETPAQTAKEAGQGDVQAKRLLAKQTATKKS